jgi:diguanylate cyclase (GGDEF)-like protein
MFSDDDIKFLNTLASRAANAIYRVQQYSQAQHFAKTDHVTGIHNRRELFNLGELEFRRARRFSRPLSAIMLDIDHFKNVNDTYGHAKGDQVLFALAEFLKIHLREFDILGRYGGEEFVIVLPGADITNARNVAFRLRQGVQERPMVNGTVSITVSLGVAQMSEEITDFQGLMNKADMAMYDAKRAGRNRVAWKE